MVARRRSARRPRAARPQRARGLVTVVCLAVLTACGSVPPPPSGSVGPAGREVPENTVYVVRHGWHTGLVIDRASLGESGVMPEAAHFPDARYLEFGWGDRDFYMAPDETLWITLKAALVPTPAVMHLAAVERPGARGPSRGAIRLAFSDRALQRLIRAVSASFARPEGGAGEPIAPGLFPDSRFYPATGRFHLLNTCNSWTARMLAAAGLDIWAPLSTTLNAGRGA